MFQFCITILVKIMVEKFGKIYLIDDDEIAVYLTNILLYKTSFADEVVTYNRSIEGLNKLLNSSPDDLPELIFLDINMPELDGWEFLDQLKKHNLKIPVYIITSSIDPSDKARAYAHKLVSGLVTKPLTKNCLDKVKRLYASTTTKSNRKKEVLAVSV